jgi:hypothetical protein
MDITAQDRAFYHSFPRLKLGDTAESATVVEKGLNLLRAIKDVGLVLAPEVVEWSIPQIDGTTKLLRRRQVRICFTELSPSELASHAKVFGPFVVQFSISLLRQVGVLPVIYVPQMVKGDRLFSSFGPVIVWMLENARHTMDQLHNLSVISDPAKALEWARKTNPEVKSVDPNCKINLRNTTETAETDKNFEVDASVVKGILDYLGYKTAPFELMRGTLAAAQTLFYPTDDPIHDQELAYYRQREWRLIPGLSAEGQSQTRPPTETEKALLLGLDERFWSRELSDDRGRFARVNEAQVLADFQGKPISDFIEKIVVPPEAFDAANAIFPSKVEAYSAR